MIAENSIAEKIIRSQTNDEQFKAVRILKNAVIAAGAGSGKTRVISYRYAYLICVQAYKVSEILTLTFTDKAATQMHEKIYQVLKEIANNPQVDESIPRAQKALENFQDARIQTLDSYASSIVKTQGRLFGMSPDFSIDLEKLEEESSFDALQFALKHKDNPHLQNFIGTNNFEDKAQNLFAQTLNKYSSLSQPIPFANYFEKQKEYINEAYENITKKIQNNYESCLSIFKEISDNKNNSSTIDSTYSSYFERYDSIIFPATEIITDLLQNDEKTIETKTKNTIYKNLNNCYALTKLSVRKKKDDPLFEIKEIIPKVRVLYSELTSIIHFIFNISTTKEIYRLLDLFQNEINEKKRTALTLSYKDVSDMALEILKTNYEMRESEKSRYKAIMIDEFQDNNLDQKNLLFLLAEKPIDKKNFKAEIPELENLESEKLFFVGDEKQSIYRFRGADVSVFRSLQKSFDSSIQLSTNFRSKPSLIASFNSLFGGADYPQNLESFVQNQSGKKLVEIDNSKASIFLKPSHCSEEEFPLFEAEYHGVQAKNQEKDLISSEAEIEPQIHFCIHVQDEDEESEDEKARENPSFSNKEKHDFNANEPLNKDESLAFFTAKKIKSLIENSNGKLDFSDFVLLFRSYTKQNHYEKYFRNLGIPYTSESIKSFFFDAPVNDIFSLLRLLVFPYDSLAYANLFHSPFVRLSLEGMQTCLDFLKKEKEENKKITTVFNEKLIPSLSNEDQEQFLTAKTRFEKLLEIAKTKSVGELLSYIWYKEGYRYETLWNSGVNLYTELYDFLFALASSCDQKGKGLIDFIKILDNLESEKTKLDSMDIPLERDSAVRMMSIHKSKGLEFPIVFVCGLSNQSLGNTNTGEVFFDEEYGLSLNIPKDKKIKDAASNYFYKKSKAKDELKEHAEIRRLLYVAFTRAEQAVYLTASISLTKTEKKELEKITVHKEGAELENILQVKAASQLKKSEDPEKIYISKEFIKPTNYSISFLYPICSDFLKADIFEKHSQFKPFKLEKIPNYLENDVLRETKKLKFNLWETQKLLASVYSNYEEKTIKEEKNPYISPSNFAKDFSPEKNQASIFLQELKNLETKNDYPELDTIFASFQKEQFGPEDFGTIVHAYLEAAIKQEPKKIPQKILAVLSSNQEKTIKEIAEKMTNAFFDTSLGKKLLESTWVQSELTYIHLLENNEKKLSKDHKIVKGSIDLVFEEKIEDSDQNNQSKSLFHIIDFKTDKQINPSEHFTQLLFYGEALKELLHISPENIKMHLFYLRYSHDISFEKNISAFSLENIVFNAQ